MMNLGEKISEEECDAMVEVRESVMIMIIIMTMIGGRYRW